MSIKANLENILIQLGYPVNGATTKQIKAIAENTDSFFNFANHLFSLNDELKRVGAFVALSNSKDYLKIKLPDGSKTQIEEFEEIVNGWAKKYKVALEKVAGANTYYILGQSS
jgi:hypothetical protein